MTDTSGRTPNNLDRAVAAFRRHAFAALLTGAAPRVPDIAETASLDALDVARAVAWLEAHGQLDRDGELLVGAHGLTRRTTPHVFTIDAQTVHTWCAYDAVAIPVVLGATARAETSCRVCHRPLVVDIDAGQLPDTTTPVLWMPTGSCEHVIDDFCAQANLFCTVGHLHTWRHGVGNPSGHPTTLNEVPALARVSWADVATSSGPTSIPRCLPQRRRRQRYLFPNPIRARTATWG